jgi:hypothetical protein
MKSNMLKLSLALLVCFALVPTIQADQSKAGVESGGSATATVQTDTGDDTGSPDNSAQTQSPASPQTGEQINWQVVSSGGSFGTSTNYQLWTTVGQTAAGPGASTNYAIYQGFLQNFGGGGGCCVGITGNVDGDGGEVVDIGDLTGLIAYLYIPPNPPPPCFEEGNVDGDAGGLVDIGDLTGLIAYLYIPPNPPPSNCP